MAKKKGLWDNIHAKRKRIKDGSGEKMRKPGSPGAPTNKAIRQSQAKPRRRSTMAKMSA
jgi:hypothetical protein